MKHLKITLVLLLIPLLATAESAPQSDAGLLLAISKQYVDEHRPGASREERADFSAKSFQAEIAQQRKLLEQLKSINASGLNLEQDIDRRLLIGITQSDINTAETLRRWENDASLYLPSAKLGLLLEPEFAGTPEQRMAQLAGLLDTLPLRLESGRANLKHPPRRFTEAALFQTERTLLSLDEGLRLLPDPDDENKALLAGTRKMLKDYHLFLSEDLLPRSDGQWMLGREAYGFILQF